MRLYDDDDDDDDDDDYYHDEFVCWLLKIAETCWYIKVTDLLRELYALPIVCATNDRRQIDIKRLAPSISNFTLTVRVV